MWQKWERPAQPHCPFKRWTTIGRCSCHFSWWRRVLCINILTRLVMPSLSTTQSSFSASLFTSKGEGKHTYMNGEGDYLKPLYQRQKKKKTFYIWSVITFIQGDYRRNFKNHNMKLNRTLFLPRPQFIVCGRKFSENQSFFSKWPWLTTNETDPVWFYSHNTFSITTLEVIWG